MIQRIQTIYLLASLGLIVLLFFFPVAEFFPENSQQVTFNVTGFYDQGSGELILPVIPVIIMISVILCVYVLCIFLFKRRMVQMRLCIVNIILLVGLTGLFSYFFLFYVKTIRGVDFRIGISFLLPVIAIILTYLAFRGIRKDEYLVRLADRIR